MDIGGTIKRIVPKRLAFRDKEILVDSLKDVAEDAFSLKFSKEDISERVLNSTVLYVVSIDEQPIGFSSIDIEKDVAYLAAAAIRKDFEGLGLYKVFLKERLCDASNCSIVFTRTQNQIVINSVSKTLLSFGYSVKLPGSYVGREVLSKISPIMQIDATLIMKGVYGRRICEIDSKIDIDMARGDAVIVLGIKEKNKNI